MNLMNNWTQLNEQVQIAHISSVDIGNKIYLKKWKNSEVAETIFILFHDLCQYHGSFNSFVNWALSHFTNIEIYAIDYVGHGLSSGTRGHIEEFENLILDQKKIIESLHFESSQNIYYFGHGLGGLVTLDFYNRYGQQLKNPPKGMILSNFILNLDHPLFHFKGTNSLLVSKFFQRLRFGNIFESTNLTTDKVKAIDLEQDPLMHFNPTLNSIAEVKKRTQSIYQDSYYIDIPVMIVSCDQDQYIFTKGMKYFVKGVRKELIFEKKYSNMKHDLYNELDSDIFFNDVKMWINKNENL